MGIQLNYHDNAKNIIKTLIHDRSNKYATVIYRRSSRAHIKDRIRGVSKEPELLTPYAWVRVKSLPDGENFKCGSWQVVQVPTQCLDRLPPRIPIWEDDFTNGRNSAINLLRVNYTKPVIQSPLLVVSDLLGTRIGSRPYLEDIITWSINDSGEFFIVDRSYVLGLIEARTIIRKTKLSFGSLVNLKTSKLNKLGMTRQAMSSLNTLKAHRASLC